MAKKITVKNWDDIQQEYEEMKAMPCVPENLRKVPENHVFDENQSVKWNRQMVVKNNTEYHAEVARLNTIKNEKRDSIHEDIYVAIQSEVGHGLTREGAYLIWNHAYENGHSWGIHQVRNELERLIELVTEVLENVK